MLVVCIEDVHRDVMNDLTQCEVDRYLDHLCHLSMKQQTAKEVANDCDIGEMQSRW